MEMQHEIMHMPDYDIINELRDMMQSVYPVLRLSKSHVKHAIRCKLSNKTVAENKFSMSSDEITHAETIVTTINREVQKLKDEKIPCYDVVSMFWTWIQDDLMKRMLKIKLLHEQYRKIS